MLEKSVRMRTCKQDRVLDAEQLSDRCCDRGHGVSVMDVKDVKDVWGRTEEGRSSLRERFEGVARRSPAARLPATRESFPSRSKAPNPTFKTIGRHSAISQPPRTYESSFLVSRMASDCAKLSLW